MRSPFALEKLHRFSVDMQLRDAFKKISDDALAEVERRARFALRHDPMVVEFIMAMGTAFFVRKDGGDEDVDTKRPRLRPTFDFILMWDRRLSLTGSPMRFTADGPTVRKWG